MSHTYHSSCIHVTVSLYTIFFHLRQLTGLNNEVVITHLFSVGVLGGGKVQEVISHACTTGKMHTKHLMLVKQNPGMASLRETLYVT